MGSLRNSKAIFYHFAYFISYAWDEGVFNHSFQGVWCDHCYKFSFCHCKINVEQLQMGGSCRKYGTRQFRWRRGKNVVWLFKQQEWP